MENQTYERRRKWLSGISLAVVAVIAVLATVFIGRWLGSFSDDSFRDYFEEFFGEQDDKQ